MDRRQFLQLSSFGAAAGAFPLVFSHPALQVGPEGFRGEIAKARARGKPLLVLVIPRDKNEKWTRGRTLGAWVNHASEEGLADLALVDVVCAGVDDVAGEIPGIDRLVEPWMFLIDTRGTLPMVLPIDPELPDVLGLDVNREMDYDTRVTRANQSVRDRIAALESAFHQAVAAGPRLELRARQCTRTLSRGELFKIDELLPEKLPRELVDLGAARLCFAARKKSRAERKRVTEELAGAAIARIREVPPSGAKWANSSGCGLNIEGERGMMIGCGMGFVPKLSTRFLYFFTTG